MANWIKGFPAARKCKRFWGRIGASVSRQRLAWKLADPTGTSFRPTGQLLAALPGEDAEFQPYAYDPEGAKQALAASKYANVADVPKMIMAGVRPGAAEVIAQYMAEQWRQILGVELIEMSPQFDAYEGPGQPALFSDGFGARVADPVLVLMSAIHSSSNTARNIMGNFKDAEIDALIEEAASKAVDDPERARLSQEAQKKFQDLWLAIPTGAGCKANPPVMPWVKNAYRNSDDQFVAPWNITIEK
jgi:peptide/nickel transport system substrate-binding protein